MTQLVPEATFVASFFYFYYLETIPAGEKKAQPRHNHRKLTV